MRNKSFLRERVEGGHLHRVLQVLSDVMNHVRNMTLFLENFLEDRSFKWTEWTSNLSFMFPNYKKPLPVEQSGTKRSDKVLLLLRHISKCPWSYEPCLLGCYEGFAEDHL